MVSNRFSLKSAYLIISVLLLALFAIPTQTADTSQDQTFRLSNIERRLDQLQIRIDYIERSQQTQSLNSASSNATTQSILELQRQQLSLAEQLVTMQRQMLELKKEIDRLSERSMPERKEESKEKSENKPKPKTSTAKP